MIKLELKESDHIFGGYYHDSLLMIALKIFFLSIPNIINFIFSLLSYKDECKKYYIIIFITQGLLVFYIIISVIYTSYDPRVNERKPLNFDGFGYLCLFILGSLVIFAMEITCLVFFIRNIDSLVLLEEIGFYLHYITFPFLFIYICKYKKSEYDDFYS